MVKIKGKILIADVDQKSVVLIKDTLKTQGFTVFSALNGAKALELIIENIPDIIILSMTLTIVETEKLRDIVRANPNTDKLPIIFLGTPEQLKKLNNSGEKIITKPFRVDELINLISGIYQKRQKAIELSREDKEIEGNISQISLIDLLQIFSMNKKDGTITIYSEKGNGFIYLQEGNIINATIGKAEGEKALFRLIGIRVGKFEFVPHRALTPTRINSTTESLLMEGMRHIDEMNKHRSELPSYDGVVTLKKKLSDIPKQVRTITQEVLLLLEFYSNVEDIVDNCTFPDYDVLRVLKALVEKGIIEINTKILTKEKIKEESLLANEEVYKLLEYVSTNRHIKLEMHRGRVVMLPTNHNSLKIFLNSMANMPKFSFSSSFTRSTKDDVLLGNIGFITLTDLLSIELLSIPPAAEYSPLWTALSGSAVGAVAIFDKESREVMDSFIKAIEKFKQIGGLPFAYVFINPSTKEQGKNALLAIRKLLGLNNDDPVFIINEYSTEGIKVLPELIRRVINV